MSDCKTNEPRLQQGRTVESLWFGGPETRSFFVEKVAKLESDLAQFAGMQCLNVNFNEV